MKRLRINKNNRGQPEIRTKTGYMGDVTDIETISKKRNILITGAHHCGKSKAINKLYDSAELIWFYQLAPYQHSNVTKEKRGLDKPVLEKGQTLEGWEFPEPVMINGITPLSKWVEHEGVKAWYELQGHGEYKKVPAWKRVEILPDYLKDTRAVLFVDDAHKLTGRKLQIAKECIESAFKVVMCSSDENRLSPSIRKMFLDTKPQLLRLNSDVAYDATHLLIWTFVLIFMLTGMTELAGVLGFMQMMKGGRRGSRQD
jgi:hypothetical protein